MTLLFLTPFLVIAGCMYFAHTRNWGFSATMGFTSLITFPYIIALVLIAA